MDLSEIQWKILQIVVTLLSLCCSSKSKNAYISKLRRNSNVVFQRRNKFLLLTGTDCAPYHTQYTDCAPYHTQYISAFVRIQVLMGTNCTILNIFLHLYEYKY